MGGRVTRHLSAARAEGEPALLFFMMFMFIFSFGQRAEKKSPVRLLPLAQNRILPYSPHIPKGGVLVSTVGSRHRPHAEEAWLASLKHLGKT